MSFLRILADYMEDLIGRKKEIELLHKLVKSTKSEFLAVFGRRRVGKTFLIREFFEYHFDFQLTGLANANTNQQLLNFHSAFSKHSKNDYSKVPTNWFEAFERLSDYLGRLKSKKKIIFFDELPWMDTARSDFIIAIEHFWNSWASARKDIILITCGSAASWMINKLIKNKGGLHNRVTQKMKIRPFNLYEAEQLLKAKNCVLDRYQILQLYMVLGGIPFYLDAVSPEKSAAQNIEDICMGEDAFLSNEFHNVYHSLFKNPSRHMSIVRALASKRIGLTRKEISTQTKLPSGGTLSKSLDELIESGFVSLSDQYHSNKNNRLYKLSDFYSMFYLKFIDGNKKKYADTWINAINHSSQMAWLGNSFEQVCLAHLPQIKTALGIGGIQARTYTWRSSQAKNGAQVDIVIDRQDHIINICEAKYSIHEFSIDKSYAKNLRNKLGAFITETKTKKSIFLTFLSTYGIKENKYSIGLIQNSLNMDVLFKDIEF